MTSKSCWLNVERSSVTHFTSSFYFPVRIEIRASTIWHTHRACHERASNAVIPRSSRRGDGLVLLEQPAREDAPDRVREPQPIVTGDFAGPELTADHLAVARQLARRERFLVLQRVTPQNFRRRPLHVDDDDVDLA